MIAGIPLLGPQTSEQSVRGNVKASNQNGWRVVNNVVSQQNKHAMLCYSLSLQPLMFFIVVFYLTEGTHEKIFIVYRNNHNRIIW